MAQHHFDGSGNLVGITKSDAEVQADNEAAAAGVILLAALAPFIPIFWAALWVFDQLKGLHWHTLAAFLVAAVIVLASGLALWVSKPVRWVYFGGETLAIAGFIFWRVGHDVDFVWSTLFAVIALGLGGVGTYVVSTMDLES